MIIKTSDHIKIEVHRGTWYVIDEGYFVLTPDSERGPETFYEHCFLLEHEQYGDEAPCLIVDQDGNILADDVYNGFDDLEEAGWRKMTLREYKCWHPEMTCYRKEAAEDIRGGFGGKGWSLYGNCDDLTVMGVVADHDGECPLILLGNMNPA